MRHTPEVNGASSPPLLYAECASPLETGLFPCMHAGVLVGPGRSVRSNCRTRTRLTGQDAGPFNPREVPQAKRVDDVAGEAAALAPRTSEGSAWAAGLRPLPGPFLPEHCPSFTTRAAQRGHQIPCFFWTLYPLWTLYFIISVE